MPRWPPESGVERLPAGVGRHLGREPGEQPAQEGFRAVALQGELVLWLPDYPLDGLAFARRPPAVSSCSRARREFICGVVATGAPCSQSLLRSHSVREKTPGRVFGQVP